MVRVSVAGLGGNDLDLAQVLAERAAVVGQIEHVGEGPHISFEKAGGRLPLLVGVCCGHVFDRLENDCGGKPAVTVELGAICGLSVSGHGLSSLNLW